MRYGWPRDAHRATVEVGDRVRSTGRDEGTPEGVTQGLVIQVLWSLVLVRWDGLTYPTPDGSEAHLVHPAVLQPIDQSKEQPVSGKFAIKVNGEEIDHAETRAEATRNRNTIIYGGIGTEANTTIEPKTETGQDD